MRCEEEVVDKIQCPCTQPRKKANHNAFWKHSTVFKPPLKGILAPQLALLGNEERRAVKTHQLDVEQKRGVAIMYARHTTCR
jgi:hypothetical protein